MLFHHDARPYEIAEKEASQRAKAKFESLLAPGKVSARAVIDKIMAEVPTDQIVRGTALRFDGDVNIRDKALPPGILATFAQTQAVRGTDQIQIPDLIADTIERTKQAERAILSCHTHALSQLCARAGIPWKYAQDLVGLQTQGTVPDLWGMRLLAHNLNDIYAHEQNRFLLRSYAGQLRGVLSDRFKRLDSRPIVEAFASACQQIGAIPVQGLSTDTRVALKAMLPTIFEPAPGEIIVFYVYWHNSDYGAGANEIKTGFLRLWCTNYAIMDTALRQVHLGPRLPDGVVFSEKTHALDTAATASAMADVVKGSLSEETTTQLCELIKHAHEEKIDPKVVIEKFKNDLNKTERGRVVEIFNSPDVELLPPGNTVWRLSSALSSFAGEVEDVERRLELEKLAGKALAWVN